MIIYNSIELRAITQVAEEYQGANMANVWIYRHDGTLQCGQGKEIDLKVMQSQLEKIGATVLNAEKRQLCDMMPLGCGQPTGAVNAYEISESDWKKISDGFVGRLGFRLWTCDLSIDLDNDDLPWPWKSGGDDETLPWPWPAATSVGSTPVLVRDLIGRPVRCYAEGTPVTRDFIPMRVNVVHSDDGKVVDIWFG